MLNNFLAMTTKKAPSFADYFSKYYCNRVEQWAMCHRNFAHANTDTNMFVEASHNRLKTFYMDRRPNKRIDDLVNLLLTIEEDDYWRRKRDTLYKSQCKPTDRHGRGMKILDSDVSKYDVHQWRVKSQSSEEYYVVTRCSEICQQADCQIQCLTVACMGLCQHLFDCSCVDQSPLCKHIHKVHSILNHQAASQRAHDKFSLKTVTTVNEIAPQEQGKELDQFHKNINLLTALIQHPEVAHLRLKNINAHLRDMVQQCQAVDNLNEEPLDPVEQAETVNYKNQKLALQWRPGKLYRTKKASKRVDKHTAPDKEVLKQKLLGVTVDNAITIDDEDDRNTNITCISTNATNSSATITNKVNNKMPPPSEIMKKPAEKNKARTLNCC